MAIIMDLRKNAGFDKNAQGEQRVRTALVTDVPGVGQEKIENAKIMLKEAGYTIGTAHPNRASCYLKNISGVATKSGGVECQLTYEDAFYNSGSKPPPAVSYNTIAGRASLRQVNTNKDAGGNEVWLTTYYPQNYVTPQGLQPYIDKDENYRKVRKPAIRQLLRPECTISLPQIEYENPQVKAKQWVGKVNSGPFSLDTEATAGQWLCVDVQWSSEDGGVSYKVLYSFHYVEEGWNGEVLRLTDANTGLPFPDAAVTGEPSKTPIWYKPQDFTGLTVINPPEEE